MLTKTKNKTLLIKLVFGLALLFFIGWKIYHDPSWTKISSLKLDEDYLILGGVFLIMMPINWGLEVIKWRVQIKGLADLSIKDSILSVLAGISTGLITPNRIGNFIGRNIYVEEEIRMKTTLLTFHGNVAQFTSSILFGFLGLTFLGTQVLAEYAIIIQVIGCILIILALVLYFFPGLINNSPLGHFLKDDLQRDIDYINDVAPSRKWIILLLSAFRYGIFLMQYYILLKLFCVEISTLQLVSGIAVVYLITTLVPSVLFGKLFVREASALFILTGMGIETSVILMTVFILWFVNLAIPSLIGAFVLIRK